jgi:tetratricopeptide (TPR) repeat protein
MKRLSLYSFLFGLSLLVGCTTAGVQVDSQPQGAEVYVQKYRSAPVKMGQTPVFIDQRNVGGNQAFQIKIHKSGFESQTVVVPAMALSTNVQIFAQLAEKAVNTSELRASEAFEAVARGIARAQSLIHKRKYVEAEQLLIQLSLQYKSVSVIYDLLGNVYYVQKNFPDALKAYQQSRKISPSNPETDRMIQKLQFVVKPQAGGGQQ